MDISTFLIAQASHYPWASSAIAIITFFGFLLTHVFPLVPVPADGSRWVLPWRVLNYIAGNWGNAKNLDAPNTFAPPPGYTRIQPPPQIVPDAVAARTIPPATALSDPPSAGRAPNQPPLAAVVFAFLFMAAGLTACGAVMGGSGSTTAATPVVTTQQKVQQAFDLSQAAYTSIAHVAAQVIPSGAVTAAQAEQIRATDRVVYAALVDVRSIVRAGGQPSKTAWGALQAALRSGAKIPGVSAEATAAIDLAVAAISALAMAMGNSLP